ncbi:NFACT family protein [Candidatus Woesearchaeota archaeon]|nr:NFACT family protein [Candidatus Woesearchaeota archaeon]
MAKKSVTSVELAAVIEELHFLLQSKISQIYSVEEHGLLLQWHLAGEGKKLLRILPGKWLNLSEIKEPSEKLSQFCTQMRKYLGNATLRDLYQKNSERIVVFKLEKKEVYHLIVEFFSKGNIILTDENFKIIGVQERQIWKDRVVKPEEVYVFPASKVNWKLLEVEALKALLRQSSMGSLVKFLAAEVGLGGVYAEEVCSRAHLEKQKLPALVTEEEMNMVITVIEEFKESLKNSKGYLYDDEVTPFPLLLRQPKEVLASYNAALDKWEPAQKSSPQEQAIESMENIIEQQENSLKEQAEKADATKKKGETIYENYMLVRELLQIYNVMKGKNQVSEIEAALKKTGKVKSFNSITRKMTVEL